MRRVMVILTERLAMARPTKLTPAIRKAASDYVDVAYVHVKKLPTIEAMALTIGINRDTVQEWEKTDSEFSVIVKRLRDMQADKLLQKGLDGSYNPTIAKLILSKHGYVEQSKQDLTTNGKDLPTPILGGVSVHTNDSNAPAS